MMKQMRNLKQFLKVTKNIRLMKSLYQTLKHVSIVVVLSIFLFPLNSCSQDDYNSFGMGESSYTYTSELIPVTIGNVGIDYFGSGAVTRSGETKVKSAYREPLDDVNDIITDVESVPEEEQPLTRANLGNNIRFRIVAYKNNAVSTANYVAQADYYINGTGGSPALASDSKAISLKKGIYKFVCYSYNTNAALAAFNGSGTTTIPVTHGQDFLVCVLNNQSVTPNANAQFSLPAINFSRLCSQIQIIVNAGNAGYITACSVEIPGISPNQNYTLGSTEMTTTGTGGTAVVSWPAVNSATAASNPTQILPFSSRTVNFKMTFTAGGITYTNKTVSIADQEFVKGRNYKVIINIVKNSVIVEGLNFRVALGNVIRVGNTYKFQATQGDMSRKWDGGDYYNNGTIDPLNYTLYDTESVVDVCKQVGSIWRTPNYDECMQIINSATIWGNYAGTNNGTAIGMYLGTQSVPSEGNKNSYVFLPAGGWRRSGQTSLGGIDTSCEYQGIGSREGGGNVGYILNQSQKRIVSPATFSNGFLVRCIANK